MTSTNETEESKRIEVEKIGADFSETIGLLYPKNPKFRESWELFWPILIDQVCEGKKLSDDFWIKFKRETEFSDDIIDILKKFGLEELTEEEKSILLTP